MRFALLLTAVVCFAQSAPDKSAISGRVVSAATGAPLKKAAVWLEAFTAARGVNGEPTVAQAATDAEGRFTLDGVPPGSYLLLARRTGYLDQGYGAASPDAVGPPLELVAGETKREIVVKLTPQSLLYGKVVDEDGDPVPNAQVSVLRVSYAGGRRHLVDAVAVESQDDGSFVAGNLTPGRYFVSAAIRSMDEAGARERNVLTYYPHAADPADAAPVDVSAGGEVRGIAIRLRKSRVFRLSGRAVLTANSEPAVGIQVILQPGNRGTKTMNDGRFEFEGIPPGRYTVETAPQQEFAGRIAAAVSDGDMDAIVLPVGEGAALDGRVKGGAGSTVVLTVVDRRPEGLTIPVEADGAFHAAHLVPRVYSIDATLPEGSYVKAITFRGQPVTDWKIDLSSGSGGELDIEVSPDGAVVTGKVDRPGAVVQMWPAGGETARSVRADARGEFGFHSLPPGDYRVVAWQEIEDDLAEYAPFRAAFEADAVKVHLGERGRERVEPKLISREAAAAEAAKLK